MKCRKNKEVYMEDKIEVNEYVRTKDGRIAQIKSIDYEAGIYRFDRIVYINEFGMKENVLYNNEMFKKLIVKHSKQLIDLIEEGDYVNGHLVEEVRISCFDSSIFVHEYEIELHENDIKTILTKESYMANCYKVGGEDEQRDKVQRKKNR